jgi:hypothetical protein
MVDLNNNYTPYTPSRVSPRWGVFIRMPFYYRSIQRQGFEIEDRTPASGGGYGFKTKESLTTHTHTTPKPPPKPPLPARRSLIVGKR